MMKKRWLKNFLTIALIAILFSCLSVSCFASEEADHIHQPNMTASRPVYVYIVYNIDGNPEYIQSKQYNPEEGRYTAVTPDGVIIDVWYPVAGLTLVIHEIKEEAPMQWFTGVFSECSSIRPYEIFFLEERGGRINLPDGIRIDFSNLSSEQRMHLLNTEEEKILLPQQVKDGMLTFYSDTRADYYVLGILKPISNPETGDDSRIALLISFAAIIAMLMIIVAALIFRPAKEQESALEDLPAKEAAPKKSSRTKQKKQKKTALKKEGARRRAQKAEQTAGKEAAGVPQALNRYLNEVAEPPENE